MARNTNGRIFFSGKGFLVSVGIWLILTLVLYAGICFMENGNRQMLINKGVAISKDISSQSGLPVLEKKIEYLSRHLEQMKQKSDVIFASIIDHKNKLIAYTDQDQLFTLNREKAGETAGVVYWKVSRANHRKVMNFSSPITFSGTRVGEVFISLAVNGPDRLKKWVYLLSSISLSAIVICFGLARYKDGLHWCRARRAGRATALQTSFDPAEQPCFLCPLCGGSTILSKDALPAVPLDRFAVIRNFSPEKKQVRLAQVKTIEELEWLKRRLVSRSARIIIELENSSHSDH